MIFYDKQYLKYFKYEGSMPGQTKYHPNFPGSKHLQTIDPSFATMTKLLTNKKGETSCERLK